MDILIGGILPFITVAVFIGGMAFRIYTWKKLPAPKMTLTPAPSPGFDRVKEVVLDTVLFKSLFKGDRSLWILGWVFHAMLALIVIGHLRVFTWIPDNMMSALGMTKENIKAMSGGAGGFAGVVILVVLIALLFRRIIVQRVRDITSVEDYLVMALLFGILITGDAMRFFSEVDLVDTRAYFYGLITFSAIKLPQNPWFIAHYITGMCLIMYMPFSKLLHFGGIFFSQSLIHEH